MQQDEEGRVWFAGDSDAAIVKGLVALVIALYQEKRRRKSVIWISRKSSRNWHFLSI